MQENSLIYHAKRVMSIAHADRQRDERVPEANIARSWTRCVDRYGLHPAEPHEILVLEHARVVEHQERLDNVLEIARAEMNNLYQQISGSGFAIILTDAEGVIIDCVSDPTLVELFTRAGLWTGAIWSEEHEGTNGIGTCLMEKQPLTVHRDEHFLSSHTGLTCSASPIFDPDGQLLAVLDASSVNSRDSKQSQFHTVALATMSAKLIENCNFLRHFRHNWVLRFHNRPEFVGMLSEGMLAFDGGGRILAGNQSALNQLDGLTRAELLNRAVSEIFDVCLDALMARALRQPNTVWPMRDRTGRNYFAMLRGADHHPALRGRSSSGRAIAAAAVVPDMTLDGLRGDDPAMAYNVRCARRVMNKDVAIVLNGETGTGKEAFAKAIHEASARAGKPFVAVNCAAIPETLIESELFGYKHGAFTGARREGMRGKILQSSGGTLFLDEIGDMPAQLQTRLLRVLEEREILPLGCETPIAVDLHVVSATHRNLQELVADGAFREDLYFRLTGLTLMLPALRERTDKIALIRCVLAGESGQNPVQIAKDAFAALTEYPWPGNIRQLRNVLRTAVALCEDDIIRLEDLPAEIARASSRALPRTAGAAAPAHPDQGTALDCAEKEALLRELDQHRWNITNASNHLGISRNTLYRKMKKHGITPPTLG